MCVHALYLLSYAHTCYCFSITCIPVLELCSSQCGWKSFTVLPCCPTGKDVILKEILEQLLAGKKVVEEHMVVLSLENACEVLHNSLPKLLLSATLLSSINLEGVEIPIVAVGKYSYLVSCYVCTSACMFIVCVHGVCSGCMFVHVCLGCLCAHVCLGYVCVWGIFAY